MQCYSQHRHEGSWQEHLFLGPQAAGLLKTSCWRTDSEKIDRFHIPLALLRDFSLSCTCCPGEFSMALSLSTAIAFCHITEWFISTFLHLRRDFPISSEKPGSSLPAQSQTGVVWFFSVCFYLVLALWRLGGCCHRWLLTHVQQPAGLHQVLSAQRVLECPPGKGLCKVKQQTRPCQAPCRGVPVPLRTGLKRSTQRGSEHINAFCHRFLFLRIGDGIKHIS